MFIKNIQLKDFRNYKSSGCEFTPGINVIYGKNASGKTNMLEAIHILSSAKSHSFSPETEFIRFGQDFAFIKGEFFAKNRFNHIEMAFSRDKRRSIKLNKVPVFKTSELLGNLNVVFFSPDNLRIVKGSPSERRRFLNLALCKTNYKYLNSLFYYNKILQQRNKLFKINNPPASLKDQVLLFGEQLAEYGACVIWERKVFLDRLAEIAGFHQESIAKESLELCYEAFALDCDDFSCCDDIKDYLKSYMYKNVEREFLSRQTLFGPHRDDFSIKINGENAKNFSSQGQHKTAALALKLAEFDLLKSDFGEFPVLLLDDILSELDDERISYIFKNFLNFQVIITCTKQIFFDIISDVNYISSEDIKS